MTVDEHFLLLPNSHFLLNNSNIFIPVYFLMKVKKGEKLCKLCLCFALLALLILIRFICFPIGFVCLLAVILWYMLGSLFIWWFLYYLFWWYVHSYWLLFLFMSFNNHHTLCWSCCYNLILIIMPLHVLWLDICLLVIILLMISISMHENLLVYTIFIMFFNSCSTSNMI